MPGESRMNSTSQAFWENGRVKMVIEENRFIQDPGINCHIIFPELCFIGWPSGQLTEQLQKFSDCFNRYASQLMLTF